MLFAQDTPRDVQEYLRDVGNSLQDLAVSITWLETLTMTLTFIKLFEVEKFRREQAGLPSWSMKSLTDAAREAKENGIKGVLGYEATFFNYIDKLYPGRFTGVVDFQRARSGFNKLAEADALADFIKWAQTSVMWLDKRMQSSIVFFAIAESFKLFEKFAPDLASPYAPLLARMATASTGELASPFIFKEHEHLKLMPKVFLALGSDDKKMMKQPGYSATYTPAATGSPRPTLLLDEMNRVLTRCLHGLSDHAINWAIHDHMVTLTMVYLLQGGSASVLVNDAGDFVKIFQDANEETRKSNSGVKAMAKPKGKAKAAKAKAKRKSRTRGFTGGAAPAADAAPTEDEKDDAEPEENDGGFDEEAQQDEQPENDDVATGCSRVNLTTHLALFKFIARIICKTHKVGMKVLFEPDQSEQEADVEAAVVEEQIDSTVTLAAIVKSFDDDKNKKLSTSLSSFMRCHPDVRTDLIPLAHAAMTKATIGIGEHTEDTTQLSLLGNRIAGLKGGDDEATLKVRHTQSYVSFMACASSACALFHYMSFVFAHGAVPAKWHHASSV